MLPPGWSERIIPRSKQVFYIDHHHKLTTWVQPLNHLPPGWFALTAPDGGAYFQNSFLEITQVSLRPLASTVPMGGHEIAPSDS